MNKFCAFSTSAVVVLSYIIIIIVEADPIRNCILFVVMAQLYGCLIREKKDNKSVKRGCTVYKFFGETFSIPGTLVDFQKKLSYLSKLMGELEIETF